MASVFLFLFKQFHSEQHYSLRVFPQNFVFYFRASVPSLVLVICCYKVEATLYYILSQMASPGTGNSIYFPGEL